MRPFANGCSPSPSATPRSRRRWPRRASRSHAVSCCRVPWRGGCCRCARPDGQFGSLATAPVRFYAACMSGTVIRLASANDFTAIAAITNHYIRTTAIHFAYEDVTADEVRALWREHEAIYPWLGAETARTVVGYAKAGSFRARTAYLWTTETGIYLAPDQCGHGLGRQLYGRLLDVLRAQGFHTV